MNASADETRLIVFKSAMAEYGSGSTVLGCLIIDPNTTTVTVGSIAGKRYVIEFGVRPVIDYGTTAAEFGEIVRYPTVIDPDGRPESHCHATASQCFIIVDGY